MTPTQLKDLIVAIPKHKLCLSCCIFGSRSHFRETTCFHFRKLQWPSHWPKKRGLNTADRKNYRTVSNLTFVFNLLDHAVSLQLTAFLEASNSLPVNQSCYRKLHSTDSALIKVYSDLWLALRKGHTVFLSLSSWCKRRNINTLALLLYMYTYMHPYTWLQFDFLINHTTVFDVMMGRATEIQIKTVWWWELSNYINRAFQDQSSSRQTKTRC